MKSIPFENALDRRIVEQLLRLDDVAALLRISRRTFERERSAGRFPIPDLKIGKAPLWRPGTVQRWIEEQSCATRKGASQ